MRTILIYLFSFALIVAFGPQVHAQDSATQQQLDKLSGEIQDLQDAMTQQNKQIEDLQKKVSDMQDKLSAPAANDSASADDLKKLAEQVQEIDKKRQEDNEQILKVLEKLGKGGSSAGIENHESHKSQEAETASGPDATQTQTAGGPGGQQNGYYYTIQSGNTLSAIAKAYQTKGIKVTVKEILTANPGLNPSALYVGQKIFIPAPQ